MTGRPDDALLPSELQAVLGRLVRRLRAEAGYSLTRGSVLGWIAREGPITVSDLASRERVRPQSMAQTVAKLGEEGLVRRRPDPADGRRILLELSDEGRAAYEAMIRQGQSWLGEAIAGKLTEDERARLAEATGYLQRLADA